ncbi:DUF1614 domain-containing protein [Methanolobus sp.]|uniref:DUF1614 domain-containing protein n=1 Tax=Methanolobus sp. TaxID=1874737 RepID=UPI0025ED5E43|nr:DUF1614 domain-containing protein [Methanolobus sp.]
MRGYLTKSEIKMYAIFVLSLLPIAVLCYNKSLYIGTISPFWLIVMLILMLAGSFIEIPVTTIRSIKNEQLSRFAPIIEEIYAVPLTSELNNGKERVFDTKITLNLGGFVIPGIAILYLLLTQPNNTALEIMLIIIVAVTFLSEIVNGIGTVVPEYIGILAIPFALLISPHETAPITFIAGIGGILIGIIALTFTFNKEKYGSAYLNIGGAGSFKAVYVTALIASLFSYFV